MQLSDFQQKTKAFVGELREQLQHERQQKEDALARLEELEKGGSSKVFHPLSPATLH